MAGETKAINEPSDKEEKENLRTSACQLSGETLN